MVSQANKALDFWLSLLVFLNWLRLVLWFLFLFKRLSWRLGILRLVLRWYLMLFIHLNLNQITNKQVHISNHCFISFAIIGGLHFLSLRYSLSSISDLRSELPLINSVKSLNTSAAVQPRLIGRKPGFSFTF